MAKYAALVSSASEGAVTTGRRMTAGARPGARARQRRRLRLDRVQDLAAGRRLGDARRDVGGRAGELGVFDSGWLNDHLTDLDASSTAAVSWEALTLLARARPPRARASRSATASSRTRSAIRWSLAKAATLLDHATGGRFILGLGAGWHEGEHVPFGIALPPIGERFDRLESAVGTIQALFSDAAAREPGVTRPDPFYPLDGATNLPPPLTPGGPPMWLGGQRPRGIAAGRAGRRRLAAAGDPDRRRTTTSPSKRDRILPSSTPIGRDPAGFAFAAQVPTGRTAAERRAAVEAGASVRRRRGDPPDPRDARRPRTRRPRRVAPRSPTPLREAIG